MPYWWGYLKLKVRANLDSEVSRNYLSYLWWMIEPVLFISVLYLVFGLMLRRGDENFIYYLAVGVTAWLWFSATVSHCVLSIFGSGRLVMQVYIPKVVLPLISILVDSFKQLIVVAILLGFLALSGFASPHWLALPALLLVQFIVNVSAGLWVAAVIPFVPDLRFLVTMGLSLLMFCSGIFYDISAIAEDHQWIILVNPIANLIMQYRNVLLYQQWPDLESLAGVTAACAVLGLLAFLFIQRFDRHYPRLVI